MRYLILTGRFGMGHLSAAAAIEQRIEKEEPKARVVNVDMLEELFPSVSETIYKAFGMVVGKYHHLYNILYAASEKYCNVGVPAKRLLVRRVHRFLSEYKPDIIISTLPLCSNLISLYKECTGSSVPLVTCITDVCVHREWICPHTNAYWVAAHTVKKELAAAGVSETKITVTGIPVKDHFRDTKHVCGLSRKKRILIMGGGLGLMPEESYLKELNKRSDFEITMITGKNEKAYEEMRKRYPNIRVLGYTKKVAQYMEEADLIITKPGGITLFEAIYMGVPLFVINPFLGQELANARYIEEEQIGVVLYTKENQCINDLCGILEDEQKLAAMRDNMMQIRNKLEAYNMSLILHGLKGEEAAAC